MLTDKEMGKERKENLFPCGFTTRLEKNSRKAAKDANTSICFITKMKFSSKKQEKLHFDWSGFKAKIAK
jgi:hypothetical protein